MTAPATGPFAPGGYVPQAQAAASQGVLGAAQAAKPYLMQQIGSTLGGLNSTGALRSGAVPVALGDIATNYGNQIGAAARQASGEAIGAGLAANEQDILQQQLAQQRKSSLLGSIGSLLGTGLGFAIGGPTGAGLGGKLGGFAGNAAAGNQSSSSN